MSELIFELRQVAFSYHAGRPAIKEASLKVSQGEKVAILGANGSGKSTLLKILDGLLIPSKGEVLYGGKPVTEAALREKDFNQAFRSQVGFVFQNPDHQLFCSTVAEEVAFGPLQLGIATDDVRRRTSEVMSLLRISHLADRPPYELSGGEKKRVAVASVLAINPQVILLDEPTLALDPRSRWELVDILLDLHKAGKTMITATNDMEIVDTIADRLIVLGEDKALLKEGPAAAILADSALLEQANLIHLHTHLHDGTQHRHPHTHPTHAAIHHEER